MNKVGYNYKPNPYPNFITAPTCKPDFDRISKVEKVCNSYCDLKVEIENDEWFDCASGTEKVCEMKGDRTNERVPSSCAGDVGSTERILYIAPKN